MNAKQNQRIIALSRAKNLDLAWLPPDDQDKEATYRGKPVKMGEFFRLYAPNGFDTSLAILTINGLNAGPKFFEPPITEDWGFELARPDDWDVCWAAAYTLTQMLRQREQLAAALRSILHEVNSCGFLNRGEECLTAAESLLELVPDLDAFLASDEVPA